MTKATPNDYWIAQNAIYIQCNAAGNPNYIHANCAAGSMVMCYMKGITDLEYDNGHNYRRWLLTAAPTVFHDNVARFVYIAIPRGTQTKANNYAQVVFPSVEIDIYGCNEAGEQIGSTSYYYIDTQGRISSSGAGTTDRIYSGFNSGQLSTDSAIASMAGDGKWWSFDSVLQKVYFLKHIIAGGLNTEGQTVGFDRIDIFSTGSDDGLFFNSHRLNGVADDSTPVDNDTKIVTPLYLMGKYLSSLVDDVAQGIIRFVKGIKFGSASSGYKIDGNGNAVLNDIEGHDVSVNDISSHDIFNNNNILTKNLTVSGTAHFFEVVIDKARATGGTMFQTPASAKIDKVVETEANVYKLYFLATDADGVSITNDFLVDDQIFLQTFNLGTGTSYQAGNRMYWCLCLSVGTETIAEENRTYHYLTVGFRTPGIDKEYHANSNARPVAGDEIVVLGTRNNSEESKLRRQNTILISSVQVGFLNLHQKGLPNKPLVPPMIVQLQGINSFAIQDGTSAGEQGANNYGNVISKEYNSFVGEFNVYNEGAITPLKTEQSREMRFKTTSTFSAPTVDDTTWPQWSQAFIEPTSSYPYLWKATRILYTDNTHSYTVEFTSSYTAGQSSFTSTMFKRSDTQPTATSEILTTEGDYNNPSPEVKGWTDGIPEGDERLWMQTRIFSNNGLPPQETTWRLPVLAADNPGMDVCYNASETQPDPPQEHGTQTTGGWHDNGTPSDNWMAVSYKNEGQWGDWVVSRIKGEEGYTFTTIDEEFGNSDYPEYPERVTWGNPVPESGKYRWRRYKLQKMRGTIVISVSEYYYECIGYYGEDGSGEDAIALVATGQFGTVSVAQNGGSGEFYVQESKTVNIALMRGETVISSGVTYNNTGTFINNFSGSASNAIGITAGTTYVSKVEYSKSGYTFYLPVTECSIIATATYNGKTYSLQLPIQIDYSGRFGELIANDEQFRSTIGEIQLDTQGMHADISRIEQTSKSISLKVDELTILSRTNIIPNGYVNIATFATIMPNNWRQFRLEKNRYYIYAVKGGYYPDHTPSPSVADYYVPQLYRWDSTGTLWNNDDYFAYRDINGNTHQHIITFRDTSIYDERIKRALIQPTATADFFIQPYGGPGTYACFYNWFCIIDVTEALASAGGVTTEEKVGALTVDDWMAQIVTGFCHCESDLTAQPNLFSGRNLLDNQQLLTVETGISSPIEDQPVSLMPQKETEVEYSNYQYEFTDTLKARTTYTMSVWTKAAGTSAAKFVNEDATYPWRQVIKEAHLCWVSSNKGVNSSFSYIKVTITRASSIYIKSNAESSYDYCVICTVKPTSISPSGIVATTSGKQDQWVRYAATPGTYYIVYRKDNSTSTADDCAWVYVVSDPTGNKTMDFHFYGSGAPALGGYSATEWQPEGTYIQPYKFSASGYDGLTHQELTEGWILHRVTWTPRIDATPENPILVLIRTYNDLFVCDWKLQEYGEVLPTSVKGDLLATGIDITKGEITATANNFNIQNNQGETTFSVDKEGNIIGSGDASFKGTIQAQGGTFAGTVMAIWENGNPRITLNNNSGWITYYYPNGQVMKEDVIQYDAQGNVTGVFTNVFDANGNKRATYGWGGGELPVYWEINPMHCLSAIPDGSHALWDISISSTYWTNDTYYETLKYGSRINDSAQVTDISKRNFLWNISDTGKDPDTLTDSDKTCAYTVSDAILVPEGSKYYTPTHAGGTRKYRMIYAIYPDADFTQRTFKYYIYEDMGGFEAWSALPPSETN